MIYRLLRTLLAGTVVAGVCLSHYTWVAPVNGSLEAGQSVTVEIGHGHKFPQSEEAINASQVNLFALSPSGAKIKLAPVVSGSAVTAPMNIKEAGLYRILLVQDRGVSSRTPEGLKPGGRDRNPAASMAYRTYRTAVAYASTSKAPSSVPMKPAGLEFELAGSFSQGTWDLELLNQGKPVAGVPVEVFLAGAAKAVDAGKTGSDGHLKYRPAAGSHGPAVFSVTHKDPAPAGAPYDNVNYETSLYVTW